MSLGSEYKSVLSHTHTLSLTISLSHTCSLSHTQKSIIKDRSSGLSNLRYTLVSHANMTINDAIHIIHTIIKAGATTIADSSA